MKRRRRARPDRTFFVFFFQAFTSSLAAPGSSPIAHDKAAAPIMARGFVVCFQGTNNSQFILTSISRVSSTIKCRNKPFLATNQLRFSRSSRLLCNCSNLRNDPIDISKYRENFSKRMDMAGLKPHHRIGQLAITHTHKFQQVCMHIRVYVSA